MDRNTRKTLTGVVIANKNLKTLTVQITTTDKHPLYKKKFTKTKSIRVHDENNVAKVGDTVKIMETRPLSATKRFRLVEVLKKAETIE